MRTLPVLLLVACLRGASVDDSGGSDSSGGPTSGESGTEDPSCGDGEITPPEECDDGLDNADDAACTSSCLAATCGDGHVWDGVEACDDHNTRGGDGCTPACAATVERNLAAADARFQGASAEGYLGDGLAAGDVDDDGAIDLVLGAPYAGLGSVYVFRGPLTEDRSADEADAVIASDQLADYGSHLAAGDIDGDGAVDLVSGDPYADRGALDNGVLYLFAGPIDGDRDTLAANAAWVGEQDSDHAGAVTVAGDVDGNGADDLLVGAKDHSPGKDRAGAVYLLLGPIALGDAGAASRSFADADGKWVGASEQDNAGYRVAAGGDLDADGLDDLLVGAASDEGGPGAWAAYAVFGDPSPPATLDLADADATLLGTPDSFCSFNLAGGDIDGDGKSDVVLAGFAAAETPTDDVAWLMLGPPEDTDLTHADVVLTGGVPSPYTSQTVRVAGDVDGNGAADVIVGTPGADEGLDHVVLLLGPLAGTVDLTQADVRLGAEPGLGFAGQTVASAGDVDQDGLDDVLVGAPMWSSEAESHVGAVYLLLGASLVP